ncbi:hypothetical protein DL766_003300 [Monosporascus sp. MC13-8B]|uniref:Uncharacterized protein n=1 Tax=Monosporascus cannonballus TaxID=155416 RepID=A0ABY0GVL0_9PEZI|nr:hypothetical protein DL762_010092 [Monosporascus cannonballus]RYO93301.1 hypothetical protein DL763_004400 [Monosporascus cannonballus]RYP33807.1 hypothetical protein DL766_003300 [Monosporascus sp. MC13-8B]
MQDKLSQGYYCVLVTIAKEPSGGALIRGSIGYPAAYGRSPMKAHVLAPIDPTMAEPSPPSGRYALHEPYLRLQAGPGGREAGYVFVTLCRPPTWTATRWRLEKFLAALNEVQASETAIRGDKVREEAVVEHRPGPLGRRVGDLARGLLPEAPR